MWDAIGDVAVAAREVMGWLQGLSTELGNAGLPFRWETPTGTVIQQAYRPWVTVRPITALGQITVAAAMDPVGLKVRKGAMAASPNFVHSFDAAHMARTVLECRRLGVTHYCMIHDSFGTHAADMDVMARVLREEFVAIYTTDWLDRTYRRACSDAPHLTLTPPPARGRFDITEVSRSPWFLCLVYWSQHQKERNMDVNELFCQPQVRQAVLKVVEDMSLLGVLSLATDGLSHDAAAAVHLAVGSALLLGAAAATGVLPLDALRAHEAAGGLGMEQQA